MTWTLDRLAQALRPLAGSWQPLPVGTRAVRGISTDSRSITDGDVFVALRGERFDAHDFLADVVRHGAAALVVSDARRAAGLGVPAFVVPDTTAALGALGSWWRRAWGGTVIAVAGSNGKTTTREMIRASLSSVLEVHASRGNFNNQVGVPLTLLAIPGSAQAAVIEIGTNRPGEVELLRRIVEPDVAVVTSIGEEHLEGLGSVDGVLREEAAVFRGASLAVVPASQPEIGVAARASAGMVLEAGLDGGVHPDRWGLMPDGRGWAEFGAVRLELRIRGLHNLRNAMLAMVVARACGVPDEAAARALSAQEPLDMRGQWLETGSLTIINDAYNANPASMREAIALLDALGPGRPRVVILGSMRELGPQAPALHEEIAARAVASSANLVAGIGDFAAPLAAHARADRVVTALDVPELWSALSTRLPRNAVVLLKASRGVRLERMVPLLTEWSTA